MQPLFLNVLNYNTKVHTALCEEFCYLGLRCTMLVVPIGKPSSKSLVKIIISSRNLCYWRHKLKIPSCDILTTMNK